MDTNFYLNKAAEQAQILEDALSKHPLVPPGGDMKKQRENICSALHLSCQFMIILNNVNNSVQIAQGDEHAKCHKLIDEVIEGVNSTLLTLSSTIEADDEQFGFKKAQDLYMIVHGMQAALERPYLRSFHQ